MKFHLALCTALVVGLSGCAAGPGSSRSALPETAKAVEGTPEKVVLQRAQERWTLLVAGELAKAWDYFSPGYRSTMPREVWAANMAGRPVRWTKAKATEATCPAREDYCDVTIEVDFVSRSALPQVGNIKATAPVFERWIRVNRAWHLVPAEVASPK